MDALTILKDTCVKRLFKSFKNLAPGEYIVNSFEKCKTTHGDRIKINMDDSYMLLPERFNKSLSQKDINELNKAPKIMIFGGKDPETQNRLILDFKDAAYYSDLFTQEEFLV